MLDFQILTHVEYANGFPLRQGVASQKSEDITYPIHFSDMAGYPPTRQKYMRPPCEA